MEYTYSTYRRKQSELLFAFQFLEEGLRRYISNAFGIAEISLKEKVYFSHDKSFKKIQNAPLGKLIEVFKQYSNRKNLIDNITNLIKKRNICAHSCFIITIEKTDDKIFLKKAIQETEKTLKLTEKAVLEIYAETEKLIKIIEKIK